ncbi:unnamed protein product [Sphagnum balticum]
MVDVDGTTETGDVSLKVEEPFNSMLPPSAVEDDPVNQRMIVSCCTDKQQTYVTQPASKLVDVLVEVSQQQDPSSRTEYGMEIRGDDSRVEVVRMELPDSFVAPDDSFMVSMQVDCQASPRPYYIDSSMQSPEVTIGSTDKHKESPRLSGISEVVPSATSKSKEIIVGPEAALRDCAVQNEFQNNPTTIKDSESSKRCGLLETNPCEFGTGDYKMDPDGITETPSVTLKKDSSLKVEELCTHPSPFIAEEPSLREGITTGFTEEPICSTRILSDSPSL